MSGVHELLDAPVFIILQRGKDVKVELFNDHARKACGGRDLTGKTLSETLPELEQWLKKVTTGIHIDSRTSASTSK